MTKTPHSKPGPNRTRTRPHTASADRSHSFAVRTLIQWHRSGVDVDAAMPRLSTYLGHIAPADTYWYLSAVPELMELAAQRLDLTTEEQR